MAGTKASKNRTSFKPNNPGGGRHKKEDSIKSVFERYADKKYDDRHTYHEAVVSTLYKIAIGKNDVVAIKYVLDRLHGKIPETVNANVDGRLSINIVRFGDK